MNKAIKSELENLKAKINILEEENAALAENKEELLLLGLISEQIELENDETNLLSAALEKISILINIPVCTVFSVKSNSVQLITSYSSFQNTEFSNKQIQISDQLIASTRDGAIICDLEKDNELCLITKTDIPFNARMAIVVPFESRFIEKGLFLFLYDTKNKNEMTFQLIILQRVIEMAISKINNIWLIRELKKMNAELDSKIYEKTAELTELNINLKIQIEEQKQLKAQFYQSQKMEAIGKLAGGIAHDFNNLLTIINGYSELLLQKADHHNGSTPELEQIHMAGKRAANLTNQLLAFSRKQIIKPVIVNLNDTVSYSEKMLQRLIGEDIFLQSFLDPDLGSIKVDSGQLNQIIMNLAVNARDAMPTGGHLTIKTQRLHITEKDLNPEYEVEPGDYCCLSISDNGAGMDEETKSRIFEPFFTTKKVGEGTGLGLSTIFGIVKQNNGFIKLDSSPGQGSTFYIFLPAIDASSEVHKLGIVETRKTKNKEKILVVEDDLDVQNLTVSILNVVGYSILTATNGHDALEIIGNKKNNIDLLLTDVIMPGMSGNDLAIKSKQIQPDLKVLFMSGYTDEIIAKHGILAEEIEYINKPFTTHHLIKRVREVVEKKIH